MSTSNHPDYQQFIARTTAHAFPCTSAERAYLAESAGPRFASPTGLKFD
jgi:hypothetical protein